MRHILTGLAILLIVALTAALAGPYLVDWNAQRGFLEARLTQALGQKVTIGGSIDLKLLPTPYLVLDQTVIGEDDGPIKTGIRHLDLELSITPLLHGEFDITEARLEEPIVRITLQRNRTLPVLPLAPAFKADVRFERITTVDGTLAIADPLSGHTFVADHIDMVAEAPTLAGPYKASGATGEGASLTKFRLSTTTAQNGKTRARLVIDETPRHPGLDLDGTVALTGAGQGVVRQTFAGTTSLSGHVGLAGATPLAWKLSGPLEADPQHARLDKGELRIGGEEAGLSLQAMAEGDFGATPALHLDLTGKQIDIDRLSGAPIDAVKPAPPRLPTLAQLRAALAALTPPIPSSLDVAIDMATYGGEPLNDLRAHLNSGATPLLQVSGEGPGGLHLALDGDLARDGFDGTVDAGVDALPQAIPWLAAVYPELVPRPGDVPFKSLRFVGKITADDHAVASHDFALTLDRSVLTGTGRVSFDTTPLAIKATLEAKALDLDALPALGMLDATMGGTDLDLTLDAKTVRVAQVGDSALDAGHLTLALAKTGRAVALTRFHAENLGGATIEATGSLRTDGATFAAKVDAAHLDAAAALVGRLAPGDFAQALIARAGSLAPARLGVDATLARVKGRLTPTRLSIKGQLAATTIDAGLTPDQDGGVALTASLDAPEGSALLRQLGFHALPLDTIGQSHVGLAASGRSGRPLDTKLQANFGASRVDVAGAYDLLDVGGTRLAGAGTVTMRSPDLGPLLQSLAIAFPDMTGRLPASGTAGLAFGQAGVALSSLDGKLGGVALKGALQWKATGQPVLTGALDVDRLDAATLFGLALGPAQPSGVDGSWPDGSWPKEAFAAGLIDPPRGDIMLTAKTFVLRDGLVAHDATLDLAISPNLVTMKRFEASLAGGHVDGDLVLRRDGRQASLEGKIAVKDATIALPGVKAKLTAVLDLAGGGTSASTLVASLAGAGTATATKIALQGAAPTALPIVFDAVEADTLAVDEDSIVRAFEEAAKTPLEAGDRGFDLGLAAGILRLKEASTPEATKANVSSTLDATIDLRRLSLDVRAEETLRALPKNWTGPRPSIVAIQAGPPMAPRRSFDVSSFINAVATRALARESARIEAYEFDIRERAFFNQRLSSERRREEDRVRADEDARRAEAEHKARIEAARVEKLRRDEAAKAAHEKDEQDRLAREQRDRQASPAPGAPATGSGSAPPPGSDPSAAGRY